jgi:tetraacyldisaccharide 4'-kinase
VIHRSAVAQLSGFLERPGQPGFLRRSLSNAWGFVANPVRNVDLPGGVRVVGVGGPTLGGSYKTPFVLALALSLAKRSHAVAVVAHGYRSGVRAPRRVLPSDDARDVGDDASFLAGELDALGVPVVVGRQWSAAVGLAASKASTVIVDGLLQASPKRLDWSVLVVDRGCPWGSARCPPAGDLRASPAVLLDASDDIVEVVDRSAPVVDAVVRARPMPVPTGEVFGVTSDIVALERSGSRALPLDAAAHGRVGLLAAVARPERIVASLASRGIRPVEIRVFGDHRALPEHRWRARRDTAIDFWVTTGKCATKLGSSYEGKPVWTLKHRLALPPKLVDRAAGD